MWSDDEVTYDMQNCSLYIQYNDTHLFIGYYAAF